ncbi:MAG: site-specific DNA-methyltransferase [Clostridia bacterium]|nr:site-specific DNA-methyltransferase [Clostridia bacterium]
MEHMKFETPDLTAANIEKIGALFPNCITETADENGKLKKAINFDLLRQMLSGDVVEGDEAYEFTWVGKKAAIVEANKPIRKTLRPYMEESVDWNNTGNLYIEGDNLSTLKLLQESYLGAIKIIYIDPPYNTGKDFIYKDSFRMTKDEYDEASGLYDDAGDKLFLNSESAGRFHSDWCSMMYARLLVSRNLLADDGVIFISIDDHENSDLVKICNEIFGESCFVCSAIWRSSDNSNNDAKQFSGDHNYTLVYSKQPLWQPEKIQDESKRSHFKNPDNDPKGPWFDGNPLNSPNYRENLRYTITAPNGFIIDPPKNGWRWSKETLQQKIESGEIYFNADQTNIKRRTYLCDMEGLPPSSLWVDLDVTGHNRQAKYELLGLMPEDVFDTPKPVKLLKYIISLVKDNKNAIVMDFFSGSGTTADAVMQMNAEDNGNRKFIMIQLPEDLDNSLAHASNDKKTVLKNAIALCDNNCVPHVLSEVAKERIRRAGKRIKEDSPLTTQNLDVGFRVFKLDDSNMNDVYYSAGEYTQDLLSMMESNVKSDRTDLDLLFGCLLEWGLPLSMPYKSEQIDGCTVHTYNDGDLIACFDENLPDSVIRTIAKRQPLRAVFRDSSFDGSPAKINVGEIFKMLAPDTRVKVI